MIQCCNNVCSPQMPMEPFASAFWSMNSIPIVRMHAEHCAMLVHPTHPLAETAQPRIANDGLFRDFWIATGTCQQCATHYISDPWWQ